MPVLVLKQIKSTYIWLNSKVEVRQNLMILNWLIGSTFYTSLALEKEAGLPSFMEKVPFLNKMFRYKAYSHSFFRMKCTFYVVLDAAPYF